MWSALPVCIPARRDRLPHLPSPRLRFAPPAPFGAWRSPRHALAADDRRRPEEKRAEALPVSKTLTTDRRCPQRYPTQAANRSSRTSSKISRKAGSGARQMVRYLSRKSSQAVCSPRGAVTLRPILQNTASALTRAHRASQRIRPTPYVVSSASLPDGCDNPRLLQRAA